MVHGSGRLVDWVHEILMKSGCVPHRFSIRRGTRGRQGREQHLMLLGQHRRLSQVVNGMLEGGQIHLLREIFRMMPGD